MDYGNQISIVSLIIYGLAVYYATIVLVDECGPFDLFVDLRLLTGMSICFPVDGDEEWVTVERPSRIELAEAGDGVEWESGDGYWSKVLSCHRCLAPYIGLLMLPVALIAPVALLPLAAGGATMAMKE